jgi:hypothetical protein
MKQRKWYIHSIHSISQKHKLNPILTYVHFSHIYIYIYIYSEHHQSELHDFLLMKQKVVATTSRSCAY